jgi:hypothetical protein
MFFYSHENLCSKLQGGRILMRPPCYKSQNKFITKRKYSTCTDGITQHALKGQKLLAQGNALGYYACKLVAL